MQFSGHMNRQNFYKKNPDLLLNEVLSCRSQESHFDPSSAVHLPFCEHSFNGENIILWFPRSTWKQRMSLSRFHSNSALRLYQRSMMKFLVSLLVSLLFLVSLSDYVWFCLCKLLQKESIYFYLQSFFLAIRFATKPVTFWVTDEWLYWLKWYNF